MRRNCSVKTFFWNKTVNRGRRKTGKLPKKAKKYLKEEVKTKIYAGNVVAVSLVDESQEKKNEFKELFEELGDEARGGVFKGTFGISKDVETAFFSKSPSFFFCARKEFRNSVLEFAERVEKVAKRRKLRVCSTIQFGKEGLECTVRYGKVNDVVKVSQSVQRYHLSFRKFQNEECQTHSILKTISEFERFPCVSIQNSGDLAFLRASKFILCPVVVVMSGEELLISSSVLLMVMGAKYIPSLDEQLRGDMGFMGGYQKAENHRFDDMLELCELFLKKDWVSFERKLSNMEELGIEKYLYMKEKKLMPYSNKMEVERKKKFIARLKGLQAFYV